MKRRLEAAAIKKGRSLSQEAELRLERTLDMGRHLIISRGDYWSPIFLAKGELWVPLGDDPRDFPIPADEPEHQEHWVRLRIDDEDLGRLWNALNGAPWPYRASNKKNENAGDRRQQKQDEIKRGK
jgi:hypothetical protein